MKLTSRALTLSDESFSTISRTSLELTFAIVATRVAVTHEMQEMKVVEVLECVL